MPAVVLSFAPLASKVEASTTSIPNAGFEGGNLTGWSIGSQNGTLGASITGNGTGVTAFNGSRLFTHGTHGAMGTPGSPYYAPAVAAGTWTFSPKGGTYAALLQPKSQQTFAQAAVALGLSTAETNQLKSTLTQQASASGFGGGNPTDAAWITREVALTAGVTYTMSWNYVGTDYVPFNDGSITTLVSVSTPSTPTITVNNFVQSYAMLGFTNPGTGDYSTNSFGATGWQMSTYEVSVTGTYKLGFAAFNLDDTALSPALMIDDDFGTTLSCNPSGGSCVTFGGVEPNNETAPTLPPTTTAPETTTTTSTTTTTTTTTTVPPQATSLVVTSLADDGSSGTLRWAITQANATSGGIYDSITFDVNGIIVLTSALPQISQSVTITGNGRTDTIVDGNNLYRPFYVQSGKTLTISNMTLKQGQVANGGLIYNSQGTVVATNIRFTGMNGGSAVWNNNGGSTATYTNCTFDYLNNGIAGDYGSTPQLAAGVTTWANEADSVFGNKTYVNNCVFDHNNAGIYNYRFTKVVNSTFTNNSYAANVTGLNRTQILNSTFDHNSIAIYHNAWIPTTFNMGTDNRLIDGNTFTNNSMAIYLDDGFNNGQKTPQWATVTNNSFDENGTWITYYLWNGTSNVSGNVGFNEETQLFVHSANASVAPTTTTTTTATTTTTTITTTTEPASTTTTSEVPTTTTTQESVVVPVAPEPETTLPEESIPATEETTPEETTTEETTVTTEPEIIPSDDNTEETTTTVPEPTPDTEVTEEENVVSEEEVIAIVEDIASTGITEELVSVLSSGDLSEEQVAQIVDAVIETIVPGEVTAEILDVLESDALTDEQVAEIVDAILEEEISEEAAVALATSAAVLESINADQATEIFAAVDAGALTEEAKSDITAAVQDAPTEVKEAFEEEIDVYGDGFDEYVPTGSKIPVGERRTLIAATAALATAAAAGAAGGRMGGGSGGSGGGSGGSSGGGGSSSGAGKKPEEEGEGGGELVGLEEDEEKEPFTRNSIFKYLED